MSSYVLAQSAEDRLVDIFEWTVDKFGRDQAVRYRSDLIGRCADLAAGRVMHRSCREALVPDAARDLWFARAGEHYVIFAKRAQLLVILDFIHVRMDLGQRLAGLAGPE